MLKQDKSKQIINWEYDKNHEHSKQKTNLKSTHTDPALYFYNNKVIPQKNVLYNTNGPLTLAKNCKKKQTIKEVID